MQATANVSSTLTSSAPVGNKRPLDTFDNEINMITPKKSVVNSSIVATFDLDSFTTVIPVADSDIDLDLQFFVKTSHGEQRVTADYDKLCLMYTRNYFEIPEGFTLKSSAIRVQQQAENRDFLFAKIYKDVTLDNSNYGDEYFKLTPDQLMRTVQIMDRVGPPIFDFTKQNVNNLIAAITCGSIVAKCGGDQEGVEYNWAFLCEALSAVGLGIPHLQVHPSDMGPRLRGLHEKLWFQQPTRENLEFVQSHFAMMFKFTEKRILKVLQWKLRTVTSLEIAGILLQTVRRDKTTLHASIFKTAEILCLFVTLRRHKILRNSTNPETAVPILCGYGYAARTAAAVALATIMIHAFVFQATCPSHTLANGNISRSLSDCARGAAREYLRPGKQLSQIASHFTTLAGADDTGTRALATDLFALHFHQLNESKLRKALETGQPVTVTDPTVLNRHLTNLIKHN